MLNARARAGRLLLALAALAVGAAPLAAQAQSSAELRAQYVKDIENLGSKFADLAGAMGADTYTWRPMEGVRSVSEVYMLVAAESYLVPGFWNATPPEGVTPGPAAFGTLSKISDKGEVVGHVKKSFDYFKGVVAGLSDEQMGSSVKFFGREGSVSDALYAILSDMHEHLGQAIAYARMNKVVPPWTARRQQKG